MKTLVTVLIVFFMITALGLTVLLTMVWFLANAKPIDLYLLDNFFAVSPGGLLVMLICNLFLVAWLVRVRGSFASRRSG